MSALEIVRARDMGIVGYACEKCGIFRSVLSYARAGQHVAAHDDAEQCCEPKWCACGDELKKYETECSQCRGMRWARKVVGKEARAFEKAKKVALDDYDGAMVVRGDECLNTDELRDRIHDGEIDDEYVWGTSVETATFDLAEAIGESLNADEHHEYAFDQVNTDKLAAAQALVDEALATVRTYREDPSIAVILPESARTESKR